MSMHAKRGRPRVGSGKQRRITLRVSDDFFKELEELSKLDGMTKTDYIIKSVKTQSALTKIRNEPDDEEENYYDDFDEFDDD